MIGLNRHANSHGSRLPMPSGEAIGMGKRNPC